MIRARSARQRPGNPARCTSSARSSSDSTITAAEGPGCDMPCRPAEIPSEFRAHHTSPRLVVRLGPEDDLAVGVAAFELGVGLVDLRQRVDLRDRHLEVSVGDQAGQLGEHLGARPGRCPPVGLHPVLLGGREIDDGSIRSAATPRVRASSTYPSPWVSMKASTPLGAAALIRSATPSPYSTGITPWLFNHSWLFSLARPMTVAPVRRAS